MVCICRTTTLANRKHFLNRETRKLFEVYATPHIFCVKNSYQGFIQDFQLGGGRCCVWVNWDGRVYFLLALPVGTATVERSFSHMKMIKTRLRNHLSDENLTHLMRIAIEGPDLSEVNFNEILDIFKEKNRRIRL